MQFMAKRRYNDYPVEGNLERIRQDRAYEEDLGLSSFGLASVPARKVFDYLRY